jgi:hypothetical protein
MSGQRNRRTEATRVPDHKPGKVTGASLSPPTMAERAQRQRQMQISSGYPTLGPIPSMVRASDSAFRQRTSAHMQGMCINPTGHPDDARTWGSFCQCFCGRCFRGERCVCSRCPCRRK